ncbi:hypothetical protein AWB68_07453 [Caballeronia choica]|uniref:Uncharacterized protein n=1 Tax=Caballeronia choica TaxID=326476 RepID=A0A158KUP6_9BURK|nr:hypothetical protein AWB68_07453 [Caballeronia choica]
MIRHPHQNQRVVVMQGQYAGCTAKVVRLLSDHGKYGFVEVELDAPEQKKPLCRSSARSVCQLRGAPANRAAEAGT